MCLLRISPYRMSRFSGLCLFITAYVCLFIVASAILFGSLFKIPKSHSIAPDSCAIARSNVNHKCFEYYGSSPENAPLEKQIERQQIKNHHSVNGNLFSRSALDHYWPYSHSGIINCTSLQEVSDTEFVAAGWTKIVYKAKFHGQKIAIKTARLDGHDVQECQEKLGATLATCYQRVNAKIIKEIILLTELAHENVVKILGFCISDIDGSATLVTELGEPMDTVRLLQISWEDRLRLVLGIAHLLYHFAHSPLGSISINDFRREQFVIVDGTIKVTDLDDVGIGEPNCVDDDACSNMADFSVNVNGQKEDFTLSVAPCIDLHCIGHNSRMNIWHAGQHFVKLLLPIGAPLPLQPYIEDLLATYELKKSALVGDVTQILEATQVIVSHYKSGDYFNSSDGFQKLGFRKIDDGDLPGMFDYQCRYSKSSVSCVMSVFNEEEAAQFCSQDSSCKAVVLSKERTWTGRIIAIFKNRFHTPVVRKGFILLLKNHSVLKTKEKLLKKN